MNIFTPIYQFRTDIARPAYFDLFPSKIAKFIGSGVTSDRSYLMTTDITLFCLRRTLILQEFRQLDAFSLDVWMNGEQVLDLDGLKFVTNNKGIDGILFASFHGGSSSDWFPERTQHSYFDDVVVSTDAADVGLSA